MVLYIANWFVILAYPGSAVKIFPGLVERIFIHLGKSPDRSYILSDNHDVLSTPYSLPCLMFGLIRIVHRFLSGRFLIRNAPANRVSFGRS